MTDTHPVDQMEEQPSQLAEEKRGRRPAVYFDAQLGTIIASAEVTAGYFGVTKQTLSNWVKAGCPRHRYGYYNIKEVSEHRQKVTGAIASPEEERDVEKMSLSQQKLFWEQRYKAAQAESAEFKGDVLRGEYLRREVVVGDLKRFAVVLRRSLQGLGRKLSREIASQIGAIEARRFDQLITSTVDDALMQLSVEGVYRNDDN